MPERQLREKEEEEKKIVNNIKQIFQEVCVILIKSISLELINNINKLADEKSHIFSETKQTNKSLLEIYKSIKIWVI